MKLKLFLLTRRDHPEFDEVAGFLIRANSEAHARWMATQEARDEGWGAWVDPSVSTCEELTEDGVSGILLRDFRAS